MNKELPPLRVGKYEVPHSLVQGGMAIRISTAPLASAVANEGGIGTIAGSAIGIDPKITRPEEYFENNLFELAQEIRRARELSPKGILAVNLMVAAADYTKMVRRAIREGAQIIVSGAGLPLKLPEYAKENPEVALVPILSTLKGVRVLCQKWMRDYGRLPDAIVIETPNEAGGHLGEKFEKIGDPHLDLKVVIPQVVAYLKNVLRVEIPVIAAGGIWTPEDIQRAVFAYGANGVQIGTRFITTNECDVAQSYKEAHLMSQKEDITLIHSPVGMPGRAYRNEFIQKMERGERIRQGPCVQCLEYCQYLQTGKGYCIIRALDTVQRGGEGVIFTGSQGYRADKIISVRELMRELVGQKG